MSESPFSEAVSAPSGESVCGFIACGFFEAAAIQWLSLY